MTGSGGRAFANTFNDFRLASTHAHVYPGGDVDSPGGNGETPMHCAAQNGHSEVLQALLTAGEWARQSVPVASWLCPRVYVCVCCVVLTCVRGFP